MQKLNEKFNAISRENFSVNLIDGVTGQTLWDSGDRRINPLLNNVRNIVPNHLIVDLPELYELASQLIEHKQALEGVEKEKRIKLVKDWNPHRFHEQYGPEVICCRLIKREHSKMSKEGDRFQSRRPYFDRDIPVKEPGLTLTLTTAPMDNIIEFKCWSTDSFAADERALWLENLFIDFAWVFKSEGVERWHFEGRLSDIVLTQNEHVFHERPLRFFARTRKVELQMEPEIRTMNYTLFKGD